MSRGKYPAREGPGSRLQTCQLGSSMLFFFFCLTLLASVVDARRTVDLFSHFGHIVDEGDHRSTCISGLFGLCLCIGGFAVDFLSALHPADIACEPGKFLRKLLLRVYDRPLHWSPYQIVAIQLLWRRWATFSQKRCPSIGFIFPCRTAAHRRRQACLVDCHCLRSGDVGQPTKCTKPLPWSAVSSWSIFVLLLKRHTGSDTEHHGARAERRNSSITSRSTPVRHFFLRFQSDLRPGPPVMYRAACREAQRDFAQRLWGTVPLQGNSYNL